MLIAQIALNGTASLDTVVAFYVDTLGFLPTAGGLAVGGPEIARLQGIDAPTAELDMRWAVDRTDFMQLELFTYTQPVPRPRPTDWSPADVGYNVVTVHVSNFDATLARLADHGAAPLSPAAGPAGDRRACVADPNGNLIELVERDPAPQVEAIRPEANAAVRGIRITVPDLAGAQAFFTETLGLTASAAPIHDATHEALWGLAGRVPELVALTDGRMVVELANYGPATRDWPEDHRISDVGVLNIAFASSDNKQDYDDTRARIMAAGPHTVHPEAVLRPDLQGSYVTSDQGFSVELIYIEPSAFADFGWAPLAQPEERLTESGTR
jgi:catechol 2,3-dioxygenase-like lactoylglutathione lyase family enzyme